MTLKSTRYRRVLPAALNRRSVARRLINISGVAVERGKKTKVEAILLDISIYGCRLQLDAILPVGELVHIHLRDRESILARVVWQKSCEIGCRFQEAISSKKMKSMIPSG